MGYTNVKVFAEGFPAWMKAPGSYAAVARVAFAAVGVVGCGVWLVRLSGDAAAGNHIDVELLVLALAPVAKRALQQILLG